MLKLGYKRSVTHSSCLQRPSNVSFERQLLLYLQLCFYPSWLNPRFRIHVNDIKASGQRRGKQKIYWITSSSSESTRRSMHDWHIERPTSPHCPFLVLLIIQWMYINISIRVPCLLIRPSCLRWIWTPWLKSLNSGIDLLSFKYRTSWKSFRQNNFSSITTRLSKRKTPSLWHSSGR